MREALLVLLIAVALAMLATLGRMPFEQAIIVGGWLIVLGLLIGLPCGVLYHVLLHRALTRAGGAPRGWIWHPTKLHDGVPRSERARFMPSFWTGAAACGLVFFGCAVVFVAAIGELLF